MILSWTVCASSSSSSPLFSIAVASTSSGFSSIHAIVSAIAVSTRSATSWSS
ncbi:hypothetical protein [Cellulosimicrobium sp. CUA-896]|uniref:hypothetical protein n=1 Tax=Cellulosimicrobium sp. CUA-896 TaxID=1517881 RepID=UPI0021019357|nr:hypothetical protein [Cellulosimicrobium sp. CUA-896]